MSPEMSPEILFLFSTDTLIDQTLHHSFKLWFRQPWLTLSSPTMRPQTAELRGGRWVALPFLINGRLWSWLQVEANALFVGLLIGGFHMGHPTYLGLFDNVFLSPEIWDMSNRAKLYTVGIGWILHCKWNNGLHNPVRPVFPIPVWHNVFPLISGGRLR